MRIVNRNGCDVRRKRMTRKEIAADRRARKAPETKAEKPAAA